MEISKNGRWVKMEIWKNRKLEKWIGKIEIQKNRNLLENSNLENANWEK